VSLSLPATEGNSLLLEANAFVPDSEERILRFPSFLGLQGCLEWVRFAIDPLDQMFYFGPLS